jgi:hypothetical protein
MKIERKLLRHSKFNIQKQKTFFPLNCILWTRGLFFVLILLCHPSEDSLQWSSILDVSPSKDGKSTVGWGDCQIQTLGLQVYSLVSLPISHHSSRANNEPPLLLSQWATTAPNTFCILASHWLVITKEYEILRSPGSGASLLKREVYNYCTMRGICLLNRAISPTFLPFTPDIVDHQMYFPPSSPLDVVDSSGVFSSWGSRVIFKRIAALNSDHGPVLGRLVRCLGFLVLYILWWSPSLFTFSWWSLSLFPVDRYLLFLLRIRIVQ